MMSRLETLTKDQVKDRKAYSDLRGDYNQLDERLTDLTEEYSDYKVKATEEQEHMSTQVADMTDWVFSDVSFFSSKSISGQSKSL